MKPRGASAPRRRRWPWLLAAGVFLVWFALHQATWLRPLLQHHVQARSQRHVVFDELSFGLSRDLKPTLRLRGLRIDNAPWADQRPMVVAGEVRFTFAWRSLTGGHILVNRLELSDAQVDLEHSADGRRNWRLTQPDDRGPGRIRVLTLDARRSSLRFVQAARDLEIDSTIAPLDQPLPIAGHEGLPLTKHLAIRGVRGGQRFDAALEVSDVLSFLDPATSFAVQGDVTSLRSRMRVQGRIANLIELGDVDAHVDLSGASLAELNPLLKSALPASRPFSIDTLVRKTGTRTEFSALAATLGSSDAAGQLTHVRDDDAARRVVDVRLASRSIDLADWPLAPPQADDAVDAKGLKEADATFAWTVGRLKMPWLPQARHARLAGALAGGVLRVDSLAFESAGGKVTAAATFDANQAPPQAALRADLDGIRLDQLLPPQAENDRIAGTVGVHAALQSSGTTPAALLRRSSGLITAATSHVSISSRLDARLALSG
ncbi:MAG TPA: AsmA family protein, partial [Burkholderiaceae bacterium]|nr:AsmA family protein [Burkholderiaceae bacterium]